MVLWMDEIHFAPPKKAGFLVIPQRKYQQTMVSTMVSMQSGAKWMSSISIGPCWPKNCHMPLCYAPHVGVLDLRPRVFGGFLERISECSTRLAEEASRDGSTPNTGRSSRASQPGVDR